MAPPRPTVIRRGRLLDGATRKGELADILIEDDTILEIGPPGLDAPEAATTVDATDRLLIPGLVNAHTHGDTSFAKGHGQAYTLELLLNAVPAVGLGRRSGGQAPGGQARGRRDALQGMHGVLRSVLGATRPDRRGSRGGGHGVSRRRHARGGGTPDG